jgi:hypothetical protein
MWKIGKPSPKMLSLYGKPLRFVCVIGLARCNLRQFAA